MGLMLGEDNKIGLISLILSRGVIEIEILKITIITNDIN
jgi:hypothetical protein